MRVFGAVYPGFFSPRAGHGFKIRFVKEETQKNKFFFSLVGQLRGGGVVLNHYAKIHTFFKEKIDEKHINH